MKEKYQILEQRVEGIAKIQKEHIEIMSEYIRRAGGLFEGIMKSIRLVIISMFLIIFMEPIGALIIFLIEKADQYWHSLSENWQIALFSLTGAALFGILCVFLGAYLQKRSDLNKR